MPTGDIKKPQEGAGRCRVEKPLPIQRLPSSKLGLNSPRPHPRLFLPSTYILRMADIPEKKSPEQKQAEASEGYASYRAEQAAAHANMLRLRSERLAREAANPPEAKPVAAKPKVRKKIIRR
jgi:hypothetical protein